MKQKSDGDFNQQLSTAEQLLFEEEAPNWCIFKDLANSGLPTFVQDLIQQTLLKTELITMDWRTKKTIWKCRMWN